MVLFYCDCLMLVSGLYVFWFVCLVVIVLVGLIWLVAFGWLGVLDFGGCFAVCCVYLRAAGCWW